MPKLRIEKSAIIHATPEEVFRVISNLGRWRPWNPWLVTEPSAQVEVGPDGKSYSWKGKRTGEGSMRITSEDAPSVLELELTFVAPYKSRAKVAFRVEREGDGSRVIWTMDGSLPFFLLFLKPRMTNLLSMDYERGLLMLKEFVETGSVSGHFELIGEANFGGLTYVGVTTSCSLEELRRQMPDDFIRLTAWAKETSTQLSDKAFSIYHDWDLMKGTCRYTAAFPVDEAPRQLPEGFESGQVPPLRVWQIKHTGPHRYLGNAWSTAMQMAQAKEIRTRKDFPPFERYITLPGAVAEEKQEVLVCFPVS